jgi:hypothetical protein
MAAKQAVGQPFQLVRAKAGIGMAGDNEHGEPPKSKNAEEARKHPTGSCPVRVLSASSKAFAASTNFPAGLSGIFEVCMALQPAFLKTRVYDVRHTKPLHSIDIC